MFACFEIGGEVERAALTGSAVDPHAATHGLDNPGRDRQSQAGAAVVTRGGHIQLFKRGKDALLLVYNTAKLSHCLVVG